MSRVELSGAQPFWADSDFLPREIQQVRPCLFATSRPPSLSVMGPLQQLLLTQWPRSKLFAHEPRVHHPGVRSRLHIYHIKPIGPNCKTSGEKTTSLGWYVRVYLSHSIAYQNRPGPLSRHITQCLQTKYHYLNSASCKIRKHPRRSTGLLKYSVNHYIRADFMMLPLTTRLFWNILPIV